MDKETIRKIFNELQYKIVKNFEYLLPHEKRLDMIKHEVFDDIQSASRTILESLDLPEKQIIEHIKMINQ